MNNARILRTKALSSTLDAKPDLAPKNNLIGGNFLERNHSVEKISETLELHNNYDNAQKREMELNSRRQGKQIEDLGSRQRIFEEEIIKRVKEI